MRAFLLTLALIASGLTVSGCTAVQYPDASGCWYDIMTNWIIFNGGGCPMLNPKYPPPSTTLAAPKRDEPFPFDPTTTTVAHPPAQTAPVTDPPDEPTGDVPPQTQPTIGEPPPVTTTAPTVTYPPTPTTSTTTSTTTTTTTTPVGPPAPLVASLSCLSSPLGILFAGTGNPGDQVTIVVSDPSQWYTAQPSPPTVVAPDGSWQFTIGAGSTSWFPVTVRLAESSGSTSVVSLGPC